MTLYGLGTLSPPYEGLNAHQARQAAAEGKRPPRHDSLGGLTVEHSEFLWFLLEKMWDPDPCRRPTISVARHAIAQSDIMKLVQQPAPFTTSPTSASRLFIFAAVCWSTAFAGKSPWSSAPSGPRGPPSIRTSIQRLEAMASRSPSFAEATRTVGNDQASPAAAAANCGVSPSSTPVLEDPSPAFKVPRNIIKPAIGTIIPSSLLAFPPGDLVGSPAPDISSGSIGDSTNSGATTVDASLLSVSRFGGFGRTLQSAAADAASYIPSTLPVWRFRGPGSAAAPASAHSPPMLPSRLGRLGSFGKGLLLTAAGATSYLPLGLPFGKVRNSVESEVASSLSPTRLEDLGRTLRSVAADATSYVLSPSPFEKFRNGAYSTTAITPASLLSQPHLERLRSNLESVAARARSYRPSSSPFGKFRRSTKPASSNIGSPSSSAPSVSESSEKSPMSPPDYIHRQKYEA